MIEKGITMSHIMLHTKCALTFSGGKIQILKKGQPNVSLYWYTESFKGLRLELYGFYLAILPPPTRWAIIKYCIKSQVWKKLKVFAKTFMGKICFYTSRDYANVSAISHRA